MAVNSLSPRGKPRLTITWISLLRVGPHACSVAVVIAPMRHLPLFVGEQSLPRAGVTWSSFLSRRLGFSGLEEIILATAVDGAGESSGGAGREAAIGGE